MYLLLSGVFCVSAADLILAGDKKSPYCIVIPAAGADKAMDNFYRKAAGMLSLAIRNSSGAVVRVVPEDQFSGSQPAICIGYTKALRAAGVDPEKFSPWESLIFVKDGNIFLAGRDLHRKMKLSYPDDLMFFELGSYQAAVHFAEQFCNTRVTIPGVAATLPQSKLTVPADFRWNKCPQIRYCIGRSSGELYDTANNFRAYGGWYGTHGGHSHNVAIPPAQYFDRHPEYFAVRGGKRVRGVQYCLSNPEVQELIYKELLNHLDQGYQMVQLAQSDGFMPCQCEKCRNYLGHKVTADPKNDDAFRNDPAWGEQLWIIHRKMAERLLKDRPGKGVVIIAYGPTVNPPKTFKEFPSNVAIELAAGAVEEQFKSWKEYKVPQGLLTYLYNWGNHHHEGYTPKRSFRFLQEQAQALNAMKIIGIFRCGFGELPALEGPAYYMWGRWLNDPAADAQKLLKDYCVYTFGSAASAMVKFYNILDSRLELGRDIPPEDWNNPRLLDGTEPAMQYNLYLLKIRYPQNIIAEMEKQLKEAEKSCDTEAGKFLFPLLKEEFTYLKYTSSAVSALEQFRKTGSPAAFEDICKYVKARKEFILSLPLQPKAAPPRMAFYGRCRRFGYESQASVLAGGRMRGILGMPFVWDVDWMQKNKIIPAGRELRINGKPQLLVQKDYYAQKPEIAGKPVKISVSCDRENFRASFEVNGWTAAELARSELQIRLSDGRRLVWVPGQAVQGKSMAFYECTRRCIDNNNMGDLWKGIGGGGRVEIKGNTATMVIPWKVLRFVPPAPGSRWKFNAVFHSPGAKVRYCWEYNLFQRSWRDVDCALGTIIF